MSDFQAGPSSSGPSTENWRNLSNYLKHIETARKLIEASHEDFRDIQELSKVIENMEEMFQKLQTVNFDNLENDDDENDWTKNQILLERIRHEHLLRNMEIEIQKLKNRQQSWRSRVPKRAVQLLTAIGGSLAVGTALEVVTTVAFGPGPALAAYTFGNVIGGRMGMLASNKLFGKPQRYWETNEPQPPSSPPNSDEQEN